MLAIAKAAAEAAAREARRYGEWAVQETGFGVAEHKELKNRLCSTGLYEHYKDHNFTDRRIDPARKMVEMPEARGRDFRADAVHQPGVLGVLQGAARAPYPQRHRHLSPSCREGVLCDAAKLMARAAEKAGAPDGVIQVIEEPSLPIIDQIMKSDRIDLILATGGVAMVRAAYASGNPAIGVGPGNVPAYVDESAEVARAAKEIADSKAFDNAILCTNEFAVIAHSAIAERLLSELKRHGCHMVTPEERDRLEGHLFPMAKFNVPLIGKSAETIAEGAGIRVPRGTSVLLSRSSGSATTIS